MPNPYTNHMTRQEFDDWYDKPQPEVEHMRLLDLLHEAQGCFRQGHTAMGMLFLNEMEKRLKNGNITDRNVLTRRHKPCAPQIEAP